jgi:hypothetical protein
MNRYTRSLIVTAGLVGLALPAAAQDVFFYPSGGQSQDQQNKDKMECQSWGSNETGFDPMTPAPQPDFSSANQAQADTQGSAVRGSARGAARGAAIGAIAGDAGKGAAIGAGTGAVRGRASANANANAAQQQTQAEYEAKLAAYNAERDRWQRAVNACMSGRNYSVQ